MKYQHQNNTTEINNLSQRQMQGISFFQFDLI